MTTNDDADPIALERQMASLDITEEDAWEDMVEAQGERQFFDCSHGRLIGMWESGTDERGRTLTPTECKALWCAWYYAFGRIMPPPPWQRDAPTTPKAKSPDPADDKMLSMGEVLELTGLSESTLKRYWAKGEFPKPIKLSVRRLGWPAFVVKEWISERPSR